MSSGILILGKWFPAARKMFIGIYTQVTIGCEGRIRACALLLGRLGSIHFYLKTRKQQNLLIAIHIKYNGLRGTHRADVK